MSEKELLAKAEREYPTGTTHKGHDNSRKETYTSRGDMYFSGGNIYSRGQNGCIYRGGSFAYWAEIIASPQEYELI